MLGIRRLYCIFSRLFYHKNLTYVDLTKLEEQYQSQGASKFNYPALLDPRRALEKGGFSGSRQMSNTCREGREDLDPDGLLFGSIPYCIPKAGSRLLYCWMGGRHVYSRWNSPRGVSQNCKDSISKIRDQEIVPKLCLHKQETVGGILLEVSPKIVETVSPK